MPIYEDNTKSIGRTPLVRINRLDASSGATILAKIEGRNPAYSVKCRIGAAMVAEVVPEKRRVEAGVLLYTSASFGLFLATYVNYQIAGVHWKSDPSVSWRYVFLTGLIPAAAAASYPT